jgi:Rrf2 family iron-sulfur cluster assembly transcriptional regulator
MKLHVLSRKDAIVIAVVADVALHARDGATIAPAIAARLNMPSRYFETILRRLVQRGILVGKRGFEGGYELARGPHRIKVVDILQAVGEPPLDIQLVPVPGMPRRGPRLANQLISRAVMRLDAAAWGHIQDLTIAQLTDAG